MLKRNFFQHHEALLVSHFNENEFQACVKQILITALSLYVVKNPLIASFSLISECVTLLQELLNRNSEQHYPINQE